MARSKGSAGERPRRRARPRAVARAPRLFVAVAWKSARRGASIDASRCHVALSRAKVRGQRAAGCGRVARTHGDHRGLLFFVSVVSFLAFALLLESGEGQDLLRGRRDGRAPGRAPASRARGVQAHPRLVAQQALAELPHVAQSLQHRVQVTRVAHVVQPGRAVGLAVRPSGGHRARGVVTRLAAPRHGAPETSTCAPADAHPRMATLSGARRLAENFDFAVEVSFRPRFVVAFADDLAPAALFASRGW